LQPAVVVTDVDLGAGCSGIELADRLARSHPALRVVLISGRGRAGAELLGLVQLVLVCGEEE
jgi:FixJ family two-component response regulator